MLAIAASLTSMVAGYTDAGAEQGEQLESLLARAQELRRTALRLRMMTRPLRAPSVPRSD